MSNPYKESYRRDIKDNVSLSIFNCGLQSCTPGHSWGPGIRDHYLIHLIIQGKGVYECGEKKFELSRGQMFLIRPNRIVRYEADKNEPWEYYWVGFNGSWASRAVSALPFTDDMPVYSPNDYDSCKELLYKIYDNRGANLSNQTAMLGYLYLFLSKLTEENNLISPSPAPTRSAYVMKAIEYIQFNYSTELKVDDIADYVGISRSHLYRVFVSNLGKSPIDYLTEYRIDEACDLLKNKNLSVAQVAASVGFFDQFYFSRVFKKLKGVPPSKYSQGAETNK